MQIEIIENLDDILLLKRDWEDLYAKSQPGPFIHHCWIYWNYKYFTSVKRILIVVYGHKKELIGVFPFSIQDFNIKFLRFRSLVHGASAITDYAQFMIDPAANRRLMIKRVLKKLIEIQPSYWDFIKIDNLSDGNDISKLFRSLMLSHLYTGAVATNITPIICYGTEHEEAKKISNIKRRFRGIADKCQIVHQTGNEIDHQTMAKLSELHQKAYPGAAFDRPNAQAFYKALIEDSEFGVNVCLSHIEYAGQVIAAHFGFTDNYTFYYYAPAYDARFSNYGPGQYLLWHLINKAKKDGMQTFDLLRGNERYKFDWTNKVNTNYTVFGVSLEAGFFSKLLVNLWLLTKAIPYFSRLVTN